MTEIISKLRNIIKDLLESSYDNYLYESTTYPTKVFTLSEPNVSASTIHLYKNGVEVLSSGNWTFSATTNKITYSASLTAGDTIEVFYSAYKKYSDTELKGYVRSAITYLSVYNYKTFKEKSEVIIPTPSEGEENLLALVASITILPNIKTYRTPELTIIFGERESKEDKILNAINFFDKCYGSIEFHGLNYMDIEIELWRMNNG